MPDDLKQQILAAIADCSDEKLRKVLLILARVEDLFLERLDALQAQLTVPAKEHADDHRWVAAARKTQGHVRSGLWHFVLAAAEKLALVGAGVFSAWVGRFF